MFANRHDAGRQLAERLSHREHEHPLVLGLPRGGVVVAAEIARGLHCDLEVLVVRKLGAPGQPELAIGAVTDGDHPQHILNEPVIRTLGVDRDYLDQEIKRQLAEVARRQAMYRGGRAPIHWTGRLAIVVDDGIATGATVRAGIQALRSSGAEAIVLAVPVAPPEVAHALSQDVEELICLETPTPFAAVGAFYEDFSQTTDAEVIALLEETAARPSRDG